jgi:hypothetical protein
MKEIVNITRQELITLLMNFDETKHQPFVNVVMETPVRMIKTGNPYYERIFKKSSCNYKLNVDYGKRVNNNITKEGIEENFEVGEMKGKKHISKCVCVDTKTETTHYLMLERFDEINPQNEYLMEGNLIEKTLFEPFMTKVYENKSQPQERKVMVITPKIDNIKEMSFGGFKYIIEG